MSGKELNCDIIPLPSDCFCKEPEKYKSDPNKYGLSKYDIPRYETYCAVTAYTDFGNDTYCKTQQPDSLDFNCYCKYPNAYKNSKFGLTEEQMKKMDAYCTNIEKARYNAENPPPPTFMGKAKKDFSQAVNKSEQLLSSMMTPKGQMFLAEIEGFNFVTEKTMELFKYLVQTGLDEFGTLLENSLNNVAFQSVKVIGTAFEDTIIEGLTNVVTDLAVVALENLAVLAATAMAAAASVVGFVVDVALAIIGPLMMAGMLLDMWDPYGFNNQQSAKVLQTITDTYNNVFVQVMFNQIKLPEGNTWPIEYLADYQILPNFKFSKDIDNSLKTLSFVYNIQYLNSLVLNSRGEFIYHNINTLSNGIDYQKYLGSDSFKNSHQGLQNTVIASFSNNNIVLGNWIGKNWLPIVIICIVIIVILFTIKV